MSDSCAPQTSAKWGIGHIAEQSTFGCGVPELAKCCRCALQRNARKQRGKEKTSFDSEAHREWTRNMSVRALRCTLGGT
eukprot:7288556-Heterocapsa_arctica.AAC.1